VSIGKKIACFIAAGMLVITLAGVASAAHTPRRTTVENRSQVHKAVMHAAVAPGIPITTRLVTPHMASVPPSTAVHTIATAAPLATYISAPPVTLAAKQLVTPQPKPSAKQKPKAPAPHSDGATSSTAQQLSAEIVARACSCVSVATTPPTSTAP
jgi:hypothetical protein